MYVFIRLCPNRQELPAVLTTKRPVYPTARGRNTPPSCARRRSRQESARRVWERVCRWGALMGWANGWAGSTRTFRRQSRSDSECSVLSLFVDSTLTSGDPGAWRWRRHYWHVKAKRAGCSLTLLNRATLCSDHDQQGRGYRHPVCGELARRRPQRSGRHGLMAGRWAPEAAGVPRTTCCPGVVVVGCARGQNQRRRMERHPVAVLGYIQLELRRSRGAGGGLRGPYPPPQWAPHLVV
jgi:hypothetical protein